MWLQIGLFLSLKDVSLEQVTDAWCLVERGGLLVQQHLRITYYAIIDGVFTTYSDSI